MSPQEAVVEVAQQPMRRGEFRVLRMITTRWMDNDQYGHVNNVVYYSYFDTAVNGYLIEASGTDIRVMHWIEWLDERLRSR